MQPATRNDDADHLRLLSIFHYVIGGITGLFSLFPVIHLVVGIAIMVGGFGTAGENKDAAFMGVFGLFFILFALVFIALGMTTAICELMAGRYLAGRTHYTFCFVVACIECTFVPIGTILGVFTIIVLSRDSVKYLFGRLAPRSF